MIVRDFKGGSIGLGVNLSAWGEVCLLKEDSEDVVRKTPDSSRRKDATADKTITGLGGATAKMRRIEERGVIYMYYTSTWTP